MSDIDMGALRGIVRDFAVDNVILVTVILGLLISGIALIIYQSQGVLTKPIAINENAIQKNNKPTLLIVGPSNAGKTSLFQYLCYTSEKDGLPKFQDLDISTTKSFKLNINSNIELPFQSSFKHQYVLIDVPGEEKIFNAKIKELLNNFKNIVGILFVVDATAPNSELNAIARKLFSIFLLSEQRANGIDMLLAVNKTEQFGARPPFKFREILEKEIDEIKNLTLKNLKKVDLGKETRNEDDGNDEAEQILEEFGNANVKFQFERLEGNFDVFGGSLHRSQVNSWVDWIDERAVN